VPFEQLTLEKHIGEGAMGVVYRARFRSARVAVKLIKTPEFMEMDEEEMERFRAEAYLMSRLRHPNLVLIMGVTQFIAEKHKIPDGANGIMPGFKVGDKTIGIISEYLNRGSLDSVLYGERSHPVRESMSESVQSDQKFPVAGWNSEDKLAASRKSRAYSIDSVDTHTSWSYEIILSCALQAARGVLFLHSQTPPIVHRDLKCSNLVIDDKFVVKITDFGMSRLLPHHISEERQAESMVSLGDALEMFFIQQFNNSSVCLAPLSCFVNYLLTSQ
jgi:serine/threonine protein kinase